MGDFKKFPGKLSAVVRRGAGNFMVPGRVGRTIMAAMLAKNDLERAENPRQELHVSDLGRCPRAVWNRLYHPERLTSPDAASLINFAVGRAFEEVIADALEGAPGVDRVERELDMDIYHEGHKIHGHADFLIHWADGEKEFIETKSTSSRSAAWTIGDGEAKEEHKLQLGGYMYSAEQQGLKISRVNTVLYGVKDATKGEPVLFEEGITLDGGGLRDKVKRGCDDLVQVAETAAEPFIPSGFTDKRFPCGYCELSQHCWGRA